MQELTRKAQEQMTVLNALCDAMDRAYAAEMPESCAALLGLMSDHLQNLQMTLDSLEVAAES